MSKPASRVGAGYGMVRHRTGQDCAETSRPGGQRDGQSVTAERRAAQHDEYPGQGSNTPRNPREKPQICESVVQGVVQWGAKAGLSAPDSESLAAALAAIPEAERAAVVDHVAALARMSAAKRGAVLLLTGEGVGG